MAQPTIHGQIDCRQPAESELVAIASFGDRYREEYLATPPDDPGIPEDPFRLRFLLKRAFASARSESVSREYRDATESVLRKYAESIRNRWNGFGGDNLSESELLQALKDHGVGNQHDRRMVVGLLELVGTKEDQDIIEYTKRKIKQNAIEHVYDELVAVHNIGPKKATLFLRDIVSHWDLEEEIEGDQYCYLIPIDTWVFQIGKKLEIFSTETAHWETNSQELIDACGEEISPLAVDQGSWYLGANAFDILIENIENLNAR